MAGAFSFFASDTGDLATATEAVLVRLSTAGTEVIIEPLIPAIADTLTFSNPARLALKGRELNDEIIADPTGGTSKDIVNDPAANDAERAVYTEAVTTVGSEADAFVTLLDTLGTGNKRDLKPETYNDLMKVTGVPATAGALELLGL